MATTVDFQLYQDKNHIETHEGYEIRTSAWEIEYQGKMGVPSPW